MISFTPIPACSDSVYVRMFRNRSQMTSKVGKNKNVAHEPFGKCVIDTLTIYFDVFCDLFLNRRTATWNLLFYNMKK